MQMGAGAPARASHRAYRVAPFHPLSVLDVDPGKVPVPGPVAVSVVDGNEFSVIGFPTAVNYNAVRRGLDRGAQASGDVEAFVHLEFSREGRDAFSKSGSDPAPDGPDRRRGGQQGALGVEELLDLVRVLFLDFLQHLQFFHLPVHPLDLTFQTLLEVHIDFPRQLLKQISLIHEEIKGLEAIYFDSS